MENYHKSKAEFLCKRTTLNSLKEQLHSLNMRMLLAIQNHNENEQEEIKKQMAEVQAEIDRMLLRGRTNLS